jgi:ATP-dependent helicase/nuclease subunit A
VSEDDALLYAFRRNVVVAASAGTGKTHRLTALYVMLVLGLTSMGERGDDVAHAPVPVERIVATTFSRAAAHEIRGRVEKALTAIAKGGTGYPFEAEIQARRARLGGGPSDGELMLAAERALEAWPHARIDTLHSTALDVVRHAALLLGLPPAPRVAEEDEARELSHTVIDEVLEAALEAGGERGDAARALVASCSGLERTREVVEGFLSRLDDEGVAPSDLVVGDYVAQATELRARLVSVAGRIATGGRKGLEDEARSLLRAMDDGDFALPVAAVETLQRLWSKKPQKATGDEEELIALRDSMPGRNTADKTRAFAAALSDAPLLDARERAVLELVGEVARRLPAERATRGVLGFGDILRLARDALRDHPADLADLREDVRALLVDEFQDTSLVQRDLVYLLRESPASARARAPRTMPTERDLEGHGLFIVGDRKQSIYAFRGADVTVFSRTCASLAGAPCVLALDLPASLASPDPIADFLALRESRRSEPAIVSFVNAFSTADFAETDGDAHEIPMRYGPGEHLVSVRADTGGAVELVRDDGGVAPDPLLVNAPKALREAFLAAAAAEHHHARGLPYRDIAILARRRATIPLVELALGKTGTPYVVAGRALFDAIEVRDLAALVRLVLDPTDRHALATVLRGPMVALSDGALLSLSSSVPPARGLDRALLSSQATRRLDAAAFPDEAARLEVFRERFDAVRPALLRAPPAEALRAAVRAFDLDRVLSALPRADARVGNVDRLLSIAAGRGGSLLSFSRWLDRQIADETDEKEAVVFSPQDDAVRLTTIHAAKGLDFEATVILDLGARAAPDSAPLVFLRASRPGERPRFVFVHKAEGGLEIPSEARNLAKAVSRERARSERKRITYVAFTRAKRFLTLIHAGDPGDGSALGTVAAHETTGLKDTMVEVPAAPLLEAAFAPRNAPPSNLHAAPPIPRPGLGRVRRLPIATTPLGVFRGCARRFRLRFLLGLEEPIDSGQLDLWELGHVERRVEPLERDDGDPRAAGRAAHRLLESWPRERLGEPPAPGELESLLAREELSAGESQRIAGAVRAVLESPFARSLRDSEIHREEELVLAIEPDRTDGPTLALKGTIDLWARGPDGALSVVDYKLARTSRSLDNYAFQLRAYALALSRMHDGAPVRAGVLFLLGAPEPIWLRGEGDSVALGPSDHARFEVELAALAHRLAKARADDDWPGIARPACVREGCGFLTACHRTGSRQKTRG